MSYAHLVWEICVCPMLTLHKTKRSGDRWEGKNCPGVFDGNILSDDHESERLDSIRKRTALLRGSMCVLSQVPVTTESLPQAASPLWAVSVSTVAVSHPIGPFHGTVSKGQMLESEFLTTVKAMAAEAGWKQRLVLPKEHRMSRSISKPNEKGRNEKSVSTLTSCLLGIRHFDFIFTSFSGCSLVRCLLFLMLIPWCALPCGYRRLSLVHLLKSSSLNRAEAWSPFEVYLLHSVLGARLCLWASQMQVKHC